MNLRTAFGLLLTILITISGTSCTTTVVRPAIEDRQPSWDQNAQNSGFIRFNEDGSGVITEKARARYNALIGKYGDRFLPELELDSGITAGPGQKEWTITAEALVKFMTMNRWIKEGR